MTRIVSKFNGSALIMACVHIRLNTVVLLCVYTFSVPMVTVVGELEDVEQVKVEEEDVRYAGTGYMVVLLFGTGYSIGVTETATMGDKRY